MKRHILVALIVSLVLLGAVGSVSADDPLPQGVNVIPSGVEPQHECPFRTSCNHPGDAYWVRNLHAEGAGIVGVHGNREGSEPGVWGITYSTSDNAAGVLGWAPSSITPVGTSAGVRGSGGTFGVWGSNGSGVGVLGTAPRGDGVQGVSDSGTGVYGKASSGTGMLGVSDTGTGVFGVHNSSTGTSAGVYGRSSSTAANATGVLGLISSATAGASSAGVRGIHLGTSGYGVQGVSGSGTGVYGHHAGTTGTAAGVLG